MNYFGASINTFLALTDQPEQTLTGSSPDTGNYLRIVDSDAISNSKLPYWSEYITGIRNFILYYPEPLLPDFISGFLMTISIYTSAYSITCCWD